MNRRPLSILIVDDHPLFVAALRQVIGEIAPGCETWSAGSLASARRLMQDRGDPQLVLLDLNLPDSPGSQTLRQLREVFSSLPVVVVSSLDDPHRRQQAAGAGAVAFISKSERPELIMAALARLLKGERVDDAAQPPAATAPHRLSARQLEVMEMVVVGKSNKEVARDLGMAVGTVKVHLREIFERLGARNRTEAVTRFAALRSSPATPP